MVNTKNRLLRPIQWFALLIFSCALAAQAQTVREEVLLLDKPDGKPGNVKLAAGSPVKAVRRQGFWVEVDASGKTGWLKVSQINFAGATGGATAIDTGRLGTGNIVATSAARGLSAKDLVSGQPDFNEVNKLDALTAPPQMVQSFLVAGGLVAVTEKIQLTIPRPAPTAPKGEGVSSSKNDPSTPKRKADDEW